MAHSLIALSAMRKLLLSGTRFSISSVTRQPERKAEVDKKYECGCEENVKQAVSMEQGNGVVTVHGNKLQEKRIKRT